MAQHPLSHPNQPSHALHASLLSKLALRRGAIRAAGNPSERMCFACSKWLDLHFLALFLTCSHFIRHVLRSAGYPRSIISLGMGSGGRNSLRRSGNGKRRACRGANGTRLEGPRCKEQVKITFEESAVTAVYLGVTFDHRAEWKLHVKAAAARGARLAGEIAQIRRRTSGILSRKTLGMAWANYARSYVEWSCAAWGFVPAILLDKLETMQMRASPYVRVTPQAGRQTTTILRVPQKRDSSPLRRL